MGEKSRCLIRFTVAPVSIMNSIGRPWMLSFATGRLQGLFLTEKMDSPSLELSSFVVVSILLIVDFGLRRFPRS